MTFQTTYPQVMGGSRPLLVRDDTSVRPSGWTQAEGLKIVFTLAGWATIGSTHEQVDVAAGTVLIIRPGMECWGKPAGAVRTSTFYINRDFLTDHLRWMPPLHPLVHLLRNALEGDDRFGRLQLAEPAMERLAPCLARLSRASHAQENELALLSMTAEVMHAVGRAAGLRTDSVPTRESLGSAPRDEVSQAAGLLSTCLDRPWLVEDLAREVALSPSQLGRLFLSELGTSPAAYLSQLRAGRMASLLATTSLGVTEAARAVGWENTTVAARVFKRRYGVSPREFAARHRSRVGVQRE